MTLSLTNAEALTCCDVIVDSADTGAVAPNPVLRIYNGTPPANVDTALSGNTLLAELAMSNPAFGDAADAAPGAIATAGAISPDTDADVTGTASFFRIMDRQASPVPRIQGAVTATGGGGELELNSIEIQSGAKVEVTSLTVTMPEA